MNRKYPHFSSTTTSKNRPPDRSRTTVKIDRQDEQAPNPSRSSQEPLGLGDQQQNNHQHHRDRGSRINVKPEAGSLLFPKKEPEIFDLGNDSDSELEVVYEKKGSSNTAAAATAVSRKNEQRDVIDVLDSDSDSESSVNKRKLSSSSRRKGNNKFKSSERFGGGLPNGTASTLSSSSSSGSSSVIQIESDMEEESNKSGAEDVLMADPADSFNSFGGGNVWEGSYFQDLNNVMPTDDDGGIATSSAPVEVITPKTETPSLNGFETEPEELPDLIDAEEMPIEEVAAERKRLGNEYFTKGEYHRALEMYSNAIDLVPTDPTYFGNRSACLLMMQKFKDAAKDARQALSLDPNFKNGFIRLVRSNIALGDITATELAIASAEAKAELKIDLKDEKQKLSTLKLLRKEIEQSDEKKDFRKTLYLTERAKSIAVGDVSLKIKRAETLIKLGRYVDAQEQCTEILQSDGMIVEAITLRAYCFYQADSLDKALQYYKQALTLAPDNRTAAVNYKKMKQVKELREAGADSFRNRCWTEANSAYKQCLDLIEADGDGNVVLGSKINFNLALVAGKSDSDLSLSFVNKALSLNPQYVKALLHRAGIYMDVEKFDEAIRDFEAVEKLDPGTSNIRKLIENAKLAAKKAKRKDYYKILGIDKKASTDEIKKAYKKRALDHHPDRHANATETERKDQERKFKEVLEAYEILLDDKKRRRYDMGLDINESASSNYEPFDASAMFGHMFFQHAGMGGMGGRPGGFHQFRAGPGYSGFRR